MRIGELSERTSTPPRLLRYYEEQELITSERCTNGYRSYTEATVDRVRQVRGLLDAGLPTRIIKQILPCLEKPRDLPDATPELIASLELQRDRMTARIDCLTKNRDAVAEYLEAVLDRGQPARDRSERDGPDHHGLDRDRLDLGGQGELRESVDERS